jgi:hypothetical protein
MILFLILTLIPADDFERPLADFGAGHRGIDLVLDDIYSPVSGEVSFVGKVFTRNLISIETDLGKFSFEPVCSELSKGESIESGELIGVRCEGENYNSHCKDCVHISYRNPEYRNPLWVLGLREPSKAISGPGMGLRIALSEPLN